jgi:hypothetical protein
MKSFPLLWMAFLIYNTFGSPQRAKIYAKSAKFKSKLCGLCVYNDLLNWILNIARGFNHGVTIMITIRIPVVETTGYV